MPHGPDRTPLLTGPAAAKAPSLSTTSAIRIAINDVCGLKSTFIGSADFLPKGVQLEKNDDLFFMLYWPVARFVAVDNGKPDAARKQKNKHETDCIALSHALAQDYANGHETSLKEMQTTIKQIDAVIDAAKNAKADFARVPYNHLAVALNLAQITHDRILAHEPVHPALAAVLFPDRDVTYARPRTVQKTTANTALLPKR